MNGNRYVPNRVYIFAVTFAIIGITIAVLYLLGRNPICECGFIKVWHGAVDSAQNSQHLFDPYAFTHILHGFIFYFLLWVAAPRMPVGIRFLIALGLESAWEIIENTSFVIERYREGTISLGYYGDSIVNSLGDIAMATAAFYAAYRLPVWLTIGAAILIEIALLVAIRDNLILNIIMLIHPFDVIREWQMG